MVDIPKVLEVPLEEPEDEIMDIPDGLKVTEEDARKIIETFFSQLDPEYIDWDYTCCIHITKETRVVMYNYPCHARLTNRYTEGNLGLGTMLTESSENSCIVEELKEWMKAESFPWKCVIPYTNFIYNKEFITGVYINKEGLDKINFKVIKNFCIFLRMFSEKHDQMKFWYKCIKEFNLDRNEAFYLASFFRCYKDRIYLEDDDSIYGCHWPITEIKTHPLNWKNFMAGTPDLYQSSSEDYNCIWQKTYYGSYYKSFSMQNETIFLDLSEIVKEFEVYKEKNKIGAKYV